MPAAVPLQTQVIGALPLIQAYFDKLHLADTIDRFVPWEGAVPLGTLTEILLANRLLGPKPLYRLGQWAEQAGLTDFYQVHAAQLNDDLFGRALERLAQYAPDAEAALVLRAVQEFDLDLSKVHYDITTAEFFGAYQNYVQPPQTADEPQPQQAAGTDYQPPTPSYGRSKSGRKHLKQVQLGLNVLGDGAVPVGHTVLNGNTAEASTHSANLKRLQAVLPASLNPEGRPCGAPSGPTLLGCFSDLCVVVFLGSESGRRQLGQLSAVQRHLIELLGVLESDLHCYARAAPS